MGCDSANTPRPDATSSPVWRPCGPVRLPPPRPLRSPPRHRRGERGSGAGEGALPRLQALPPGGERRGASDRSAPQRSLRPGGRLVPGLPLLAGDEGGGGRRARLDRGDPGCVPRRAARRRPAHAHELCRHGGGRTTGRSSSPGCAGSPAADPASRPPNPPRRPRNTASIRRSSPSRETPEYGAYLAGECTTCHRADGAVEGIPSIVGWPVSDFVLALQAYKHGKRVHPAMQLVASRLSDEEIAALAAHFEMAEIEP